jgi:HlyD family secretion protein
MAGMDRAIEKKKWPAIRIVKYSAISLFVLAVSYLLIFKSSSSSIRVEKDRLTISTVERGPFQEFIPVMGEALPINTVYLDAVEGGRVEKIYVEAGTMIKKGAPILKLSNTDLLLDVMFREAEFFQQSNNLRNTRLSIEQQKLSLQQDLAQANYELLTRKKEFIRLKALYREQLISREAFDNAKDSYDYMKEKQKLTRESMDQDLLFRNKQVAELEENLNRMKQNLKITQAKLNSLVIKAPVSGYLTSLKAEVIGESKQAGERLGQIDVLDGFKVRARIDEHYISRVEMGRKGEFSLAGKDYLLRVSKIYPEVTEGRFEVDLTFDGGVPKKLRNGQTVHIRLALGDLTEALLLPRGGFYQTTGGNWVFVVDSSGSAAVRRPVKLGRWNTDVYEVLEGLKPGDKVVTSSYDGYGNMKKLVF